MSNFPTQRKQLSPHEVTAIYARLNPQDVEQFYTGYQRWTIQQQMARIQAAISTIQQQLSENSAHMQQVQPSAIALAALAHLQSNGVNDLDLLDRMLARGEDWLDQSMQHLAYCEEIDVIRGNYTEWCQHALEGAYDWLGSMQHAEAAASASETPSLEAGTTSTSQAPSQDETTEEMLLQKLLSDEPDAPSDTSFPVEQLHAPSEQVLEEEQPERRAVAGQVEQIEPEIGAVFADTSQETFTEPAFSEHTGESLWAPPQFDKQSTLTLEEVILVESDEAVHAEQGEAEDASRAPQMAESAHQDMRKERVATTQKKRGLLQWPFSLFFRK